MATVHLIMPSPEGVNSSQGGPELPQAVGGGRVGSGGRWSVCCDPTLVIGSQKALHCSSEPWVGHITCKKCIESEYYKANKRPHPRDTPHAQVEEMDA